MLEVSLVMALLAIVVAVFAILFFRYKALLSQVKSFEESAGSSLDVEFTPYIKLVLKDPQRVAEKESKLAKAVGAVTPEYLKYRVYKQVAKELEKALNERDIEVEIDLVGLKNSRFINEDPKGERL